MSRILLVEDHPAVAESVKWGLEAQGYDVVVETDGLNGLASAIQRQFDLLIVDIDLPMMDGLQLCSKLREQRPKAPPIILLTGRTHAADRAAGLGTGAAAYLTKPFDGRELIEQIRRLIPESSSAPHPS